MVTNSLYTAWVGFFLLYMLQAWTKAEFYTSIVKMESLLETHKGIIEVLDKYIMEEEKRMAVLKSHLRVYKVEHERAMEDVPNYLGNPINAFTLIKRLTIDLDDIDLNIRRGIAYIKNMTVLHDVKYPSLEDLAGAARALTRLQKTYQLDVHDLAEGTLNGIQCQPMTAADCFELARTVYNFRDFKNTIAWSMEALRKFKIENDIERTMTESEIIEYIIFSHFFIGNVKDALEWTKILFELDPNHSQARVNILHFEKTIKEQEKRKEKKQSSARGMGEQSETKQTNNMRRNRNSTYYAALCRGEVEVPSEFAKRLSCRYLTEHHPFLRLAPIKMEQMYIKPDVYMFHGVISDEDIEFIKAISLPRFQRAHVQDPETGERVVALYRVSQSAWLHDAESEAIARLSRRVADMTGLSTRSAEMLQVGNYGIGGHFETHYDFGQNYGRMFDGEGNRIATVMFYMSEVALGGATVFTELGLSVFPIKGAALFWMNLHPSGEGDMATLHAGCPVLRGSKWVGNKWLHQAGQEFLKPCSLDYREESTRKIPREIPKTSRTGYSFHASPLRIGNFAHTIGLLHIYMQVSLRSFPLPK